MTRKSRRFPGYKHKEYSRFFLIGGKAPPDQSGHAVQLVGKGLNPRKPLLPTLKDPGEWYYKQHRADQVARRTHELEPVIAEFYRFLMGPDRAPKARRVSGTGAVVSKKIKGGYTPFSKWVGFEGAQAYFVPPGHHTLQPTFAWQLATRGMGSMMAATFVLQGNDTHWGNFGVNGTGKISRIDFDQDLAPLTWVNLGHPAFRPFNYDGYTVGDLENLLDPPTFRVANSPLFLARDCQGFGSTPVDLRGTAFGGVVKSAEQYEEFQIDKWKTFIKASLLTYDDIEEMLTAHMERSGVVPDDVPGIAKYIHDRFQKIAQVMKQSPNFNAIFIKYAPRIFKEIKQELQEYNQEWQKYAVPVADSLHEYSKILKDAGISQLKVIDSSVQRGVLIQQTDLQSRVNELQNAIDLCEDPAQLQELSQAMGQVGQSISGQADGVRRERQQLDGELKRIVQAGEMGEVRRGEDIRRLDSELDELDRQIQACNNDKNYYDLIDVQNSVISLAREQKEVAGELQNIDDQLDENDKIIAQLKKDKSEKEKELATLGKDESSQQKLQYLDTFAAGKKVLEKVLGDRKMKSKSLFQVISENPGVFQSITAALGVNVKKRNPVMSFFHMLYLRLSGKPSDKEILLVAISNKLLEFGDRAALQGKVQEEERRPGELRMAIHKLDYKIREYDQYSRRKLNDRKGFLQKEKSQIDLQLEGWRAKERKLTADINQNNESKRRLESDYKQKSQLRDQRLQQQRPQLNLARIQEIQRRLAVLSQWEMNPDVAALHAFRTKLQAFQQQIQAKLTVLPGRPAPRPPY